MKKEIIRDEVFENSQEKYLNISLELMANVLKAWNHLELFQIKSGAELYELAWNPEIPYTEGCNRLKIIPEGISEALIEKHIESIILPNPAQFYKASERARQNVYCRRELSLFEPDSEGRNVRFVKAVKDQIVKARSVYVYSEKQELFINDLNKLVMMFNKLNNLTYGKILSENSTRLSDVFNSPARSGSSYDISVNAKELKNLLLTIK